MQSLQRKMDFRTFVGTGRLSAAHLSQHGGSFDRDASTFHNVIRNSPARVFYYLVVAPLDNRPTTASRQEHHTTQQVAVRIWESAVLKPARWMHSIVGFPYAPTQKHSTTKKKNIKIFVMQSVSFPERGRWARREVLVALDYGIACWTVVGVPLAYWETSRPDMRVVLAAF